jgi:colanic acid biosynthesis glycosyl transferase WcaI
MRVLLLSSYFQPEVGGGIYLASELGQTLVKLGHEVTVVTGFPQYKVPVMPETYRGRFLMREETDGMAVFRVRMPVRYGTGGISRGLFHMISPLVLAIRGLMVKRPDVIYAWTPPLPLGVAAYVVARRFRIPFVVNVQDLFPQNAVDLGMLHNRALIRGFETMERFVYRKSTAITVMSDGNGDYVVAKGADRQHVHTVPNWVDIDAILPGERMNEFRRQHGIGDQFLVVFAGAMGWSQGLEVAVEAAKELTSTPEVLFLLIGEGVERPKLEAMAAGLPNVRFLPLQPKAVYPSILAASDVCLVTLSPEVVTPAVPSKIGTIMSAARPILAALPPGDAPQLIAKAACGVVLPAGDGRRMAEAVMQLHHDRQAAQQLGINGRRYAEEHLSRGACVRQVETILKSAIMGNG